MINLKVLSTAAAMALLLPMVAPSPGSPRAAGRGGMVAAAVPGPAVAAAVAIGGRRRRWL